MNKLLLGSAASPYVRRIRLIPESENYQFEAVTVFSEEGRQRIATFSPTIRVPLLVDGDLVVWDSLLITKYLTNLEISLEMEKELVLINEANDAAIALFQFRKFSIDDSWTSMMASNHLLRLQGCLQYFATKCSQKLQADFTLVDQWLYCMLDWFSFRDIYPWEKEFPSLVPFMKQYEDLELILKTDPRLNL